MTSSTVIKLIQTYLAESTTSEQSVDILDEIVSTLKTARLAVEAKLKVPILKFEPVVDDSCNGNAEREAIASTDAESINQQEHVDYRL